MTSRLRSRTPWLQSPQEGDASVGSRRRQYQRRNKMDAAMEDISKPRKRRTLASIRQEYEDEQKKRNLEMANFDEEGVVDNSPRSPPVHKEPLREIESFDTLKEYMDYLEMLDEESDRGRKDVPDHPTIFFTPPTRFNTPQHLPLREPGTKAVRSASKFVVGLSSSLDGKPLKRCSGFWIDYDEEKGIGTLLTTAHLIRTKEPKRADSVWLVRREYATHANVIVHLLDGKTAEGQLLYHQPHYDLAFFRVTLDQPVPLPCFNEEVEFAQDVLHLGRDKSLGLRINHGRAAYSNPVVMEQYHYMYLHSEDYRHIAHKFDDGGPVIDLNGKVVGLFNISTRGSFIPSSILLKCLKSWKIAGAIVRPLVGLTFKAIKLLEPGRVDKIWRMYKIEDGLIVEQVSEGSHAQKLGIREGDIIECFDGKCISTTVELENMFLSICNSPFYSLDGKVHISVGVFSIRKKLRRNVVLTANLPEHGEIVRGLLVS